MANAFTAVQDLFFYCGIGVDLARIPLIASSFTPDRHASHRSMAKPRCRARCPAARAYWQGLTGGASSMNCHYPRPLLLAAA